MAAYEVLEHIDDMVIVDAGGAGMRTALGIFASGVEMANVTTIFPTCSHAAAALGGLPVALGNLADDDNWHFHMYAAV